MSLLVNPPKQWGHFESSGNLVKPAINMIDTGNSFIVEVMAPGMHLRDFKITVENNRLGIEGFHQDRNGKPKKDLQREFPHEKVHFQRFIELGDDIPASDFKTTYKQGILKIHFAKQKASSDSLLNAN